jgi:hypothetical protein
MLTGILPRIVIVAALTAAATLGLSGEEQQKPAAPVPQKKYASPLDMDPPPLAADASVKYDYDIVYVKVPRRHATGRATWAEVGQPRRQEPGGSLVLLRPDGSEDVLVPVKGDQTIVDPQVSLDGEWVYYALLYDGLKPQGSDIYKVHVRTKQIVRLTDQEFTPNRQDVPTPAWKIHNLGPSPLPGGKVVFVSDRNGYEATNPGYAENALALQLMVLDEATGEVETIGHLNLGSALHPVVLRDGRIMFSSLESQGQRSHHLWGIWAIRPDGTYWEPLVSAFEIGNGTSESMHFQTQTSDGSIVVENYYNLNNFGFGSLYKLPATIPEGQWKFGPGHTSAARNVPLRHGRTSDGRGHFFRFPFSPFGIESLTPFVVKSDVPAQHSVIGQKDSPRSGKFTHPSGAPDNHLLVVWSGGAVHGTDPIWPMDAGIYLMMDTQPIDEPGQMRLVKNDPAFHEQWPRAVVPYKRIYGVDEPATIPEAANDGTLTEHLPAGSPFGLVGSSSLYKRETFPRGCVKEGSVTSEYCGNDTAGDSGLNAAFNWSVQGADAGLYSNSDIHAIRIVHLEPTSELGRGRRYYNHFRERLRILGEIPVRKFAADGSQPIDPDGNPDTSFLAKIPADVAWTFQTIDKRGMVLNTAQTWHQVRPGERRADCGGCHAHSQKPTLFASTAAARPDYQPFDLTQKIPLVTSHEKDETGRKWDKDNQTGVRFVEGPVSPEWHKDIVPILSRSCVPCHTKDGRADAGLVFDDETVVKGSNTSGLTFSINLPKSYAQLAADPAGQFSGFKPWLPAGYGRRGMQTAASRYLRYMQARRSLLVWKIYGERLDGMDNEDLPYQKIPGDDTSWSYRGQPLPTPTSHQRRSAHVGYTGGIMPPPEAVASGLVQPLTDEDKRTIVRWIDIGAPIDRTDSHTDGWHVDDQRPTLTLTYPKAGPNPTLDRVLIGMHDLGSGLQTDSLKVVASKTIDGVDAGSNAAGKFKPVAPGVWEWRLARPVTQQPATTLRVSVADKRRNVTRLERTFTVGTSEMTRR